MALFYRIEQMVESGAVKRMTKRAQDRLKKIAAELNEKHGVGANLKRGIGKTAVTASRALTGWLQGK